MDSDPEDCDKSAYYDALRVLLGELSEHDFLNLLKEINYRASSIESEFGEDWQCGDNYFTALQSLVCEDTPCSEVCADPTQLFWAKYFTRLADVGIYSINGP